MKHIRCYDNRGETFDRFTIVFAGDCKKLVGEYIYLGMNENPYHPQGFCQHGGASYLIDKPKYSHLGKRVKFESLPTDCQTAVMSTYKSIFNLNK